MKKSNIDQSNHLHGYKFADHGTKLLQLKGEIKLRPIANGKYKQAYVTNQSVIERLYNRTQISEDQYIAARRLQTDYLRARHSIDLKAKNIVEITNNKNIFHDKIIDYCYLDAKKHFDQALDCFKIFGEHCKYYQRLITFVIAHNGYLKDLRKQNNIYQEVTLKDLKLGLDLLVRHYRNFKINNQ
jgi:hypothetical protein